MSLQGALDIFQPLLKVRDIFLLDEDIGRRIGWFVLALDRECVTCGA